VSEKQIVKRIL